MAVSTMRPSMRPLLAFEALFSGLSLGKHLIRFDCRDRVRYSSLVTVNEYID